MDSVESTILDDSEALQGELGCVLGDPWKGIGYRSIDVAMCLSETTSERIIRCTIYGYR